VLVFHISHAAIFEQITARS